MSMVLQLCLCFKIILDLGERELLSVQFALQTEIDEATIAYTTIASRAQAVHKCFLG